MGSAEGEKRPGSPGFGGLAASAALTALSVLVLAPSVSAKVGEQRVESEDYEGFYDLDPGNRGGAYRSDDVDIEPTADAGGGFNVGWIQQGEWLEYAVALSAGRYEVTTRVASQSGAAQYSLSLAGSVFGTDVVGPTGGGQSWQTHRVGAVEVHADGVFTLRVESLGGEYNLNWIELTPALAAPGAVTYYISESTGSDGNDGLTEETPLQTLGRANALLLGPGDRVLFKSGDVWRGMFWPKGSGEPAHPVRIGAYGGGARPVIDGDGYQASVLLFNDDHYELADLELTNQASYLDGGGKAKSEPGFGGAVNDFGTGRNVRFGLKVVASSRSLSGFRLSNLHVRGVFPSPTNAAYTHQGYGIKFESQSDLSTNMIRTIADVDIDGITVRETGHYGVWIKPLGLTGNDVHKHDDFTLRNSTFLNTGGAGFVPVKASNVIVEHNVFDGSGSSIDPRMWARGSGLWPFDSRGVVIQHNVVRNARGPLDSYGVHIDYNNENVVVQYNYSQNNEGGFVQILGANENCGYRFNISVGDGGRVEGVNGALQNGRIFNVSNFCNVNAGCPSVGNFIYNNTVFVPNTVSPEVFFKAGSGETRFQNNLIVVEEGSAVLATHMAAAGVSYDIQDNLFYPQELFSLAGPLLDNAHYFAPQLRMPGATDPAMYKLLEESPAKSIGTAVESGEDYFGFPVREGTPPHLGAYNGAETFGGPSVPAMPLEFVVLAGVGIAVTGLRWVTAGRDGSEGAA
jgi:hypothetical protein